MVVTYKGKVIGSSYTDTAKKDSSVNWNKVSVGQITASGYKNLDEYKEAYESNKAPSPNDIVRTSETSTGGGVYTYKPTGQQVVVETVLPKDIKGGKFVNPSGGLVSSSLSERELNKNVVVAPSKNYFKISDKLSGFEEVLTKGKPFVGQYVRVGESNEDLKSVDSRASEVIRIAKANYVQNYFQNASERQQQIKPFVEVKQDSDFIRGSKEFGQKMIRGDILGGGSSFAYAFLSGVKEAGTVLKISGQSAISLSGYDVNEGSLIKKTNFLDIKSIPSKLGYVVGSGVKGFGELVILGSSVARDTPALVAGGIVFAPIVAQRFISNPIGYTSNVTGKGFSFGGTFLATTAKSVVSDPLGFTGEYIGGGVGGGLVGKSVGLAVKPFKLVADKASSLITPKAKFTDIASTKVEKLYSQGNLKALQFSDVGIKNVKELIAYPKSSQAAKYYAKTLGLKLGKNEGVIVRVMTGRTQGIIGRLTGKKEMVLSKPYTDYEIGSIFSGGVEPTGFPIKALATGKSTYGFSLLPKAPSFYDASILLIKTKIGSVKGKNSVDLLKKFGYDLSKAPKVLEQNVSKVSKGKRVIQTRQIKGLNKKELDKALKDILVEPSLSTKKAYPTVSEVIGVQQEAEFTFIRGTQLEKVGMKSIGQKLTGRTATTDFPIGGGKSIVTDVELYKNLGLKSAKEVSKKEIAIAKDIQDAVSRGYSVKRYVSPLGYESVGSVGVSYVSDLNRSVGQSFIQSSRESFVDYSSSKLSIEQRYFGGSQRIVYPNSKQVLDYSYIPRVYDYKRGGQEISYKENVSRITEQYIPTYTKTNRINRIKINTYRTPTYPTPRIPTYKIPKRIDYPQYKYPRFEKKSKVKSRQVLFRGSDISNMILPIKTDWLKAIGYGKKKARVETIKLLPSERKGSKQIAKLLGLNFR